MTAPSPSSGSLPASGSTAGASESGAPETAGAAERLRIVLVTGMSGAGRSTALKSFEDMGYDAVDNLPLSLLSSLLRVEAGLRRPVAVGTDVRSGEFEAAAVLALLDSWRAQAPAIDARLLFLDCDDAVLGRRFTETRRRHPLAADRPLMDGIRFERRLLDPLRAAADLVIDTSEMAPRDLRRLVQESLPLLPQPGLAVHVMSFSYRQGIPREADLVFDARFLDNPHYVEALRPLTGRDEAVGRHIAKDPGFAPFFERLTAFLEPLLPRFAGEGKSYLTIAIGCTGGRHRSVFLAERLAAWLRDREPKVDLHHRDIDKQSG